MKCVFDKTETDYEQDLPGGKAPLCIDCFIRINGGKRGGPMKEAAAWAWRSRRNADGTLKPKPLHVTQQRLLDLAKTVDLTKMPLREIGELVGEVHAQSVKHHLGQLVKKGLLPEAPTVIAA